MSRLWFVVKEAFSGLRRAKLSAFFSIVMVALSFMLLGSFYITSTQAEKFLDYLRGKVEIEAFLSDSLSSQQISDVRRAILEVPGVKTVIFVSKDEAADIFKKEFGQDITSVLDFNPLPASFRVFARGSYKNSNGIAAIAKSLRDIQGIGSVKYRKILLTLIDQRIRLFYWIMIGFGGALALLSIFLVYNSMRLAISYKKRIIDTMKLVGASRMFVRMPFILGGIIQGLTGGIIATGTIYGTLSAAVFVLRQEFLIQALPTVAFYVSIVGLATFLGFFSTLFATRKYIKEGLSQ